MKGDSVSEQVSQEITSYDFFINRERGRPCLVAGNAPTIKDFPFATFDGVVITVGTGPQVLSDVAKPHYWVNANHLYPVPQKHLADINGQKDCVFIFADSVTYALKNKYDAAFLREQIQVPWFAFDERHFGQQKCHPQRPCCQFVDRHPGRVTLQEFLEQHFQVGPTYRGVGTSVLHSLAFAILMGCSPIYIQGVELPLLEKNYTYHNALGNSQMRMMTFRALKARVKELFTGRAGHSDFYAAIEETLASFEALVALAHRKGLEVFNLSETSNLNKISTLPYKNMSAARSGESNS